MSATIEQELGSLASPEDTFVTIGIFDGLHMGHQALIRRLAEQAREKNALSAVISFKQHPSTLLTPDQTVPLLISLDERIRILKDLAVDIVITLTFSPELAALGAEPFVSLLQRHLRMQGMILGWDFVLGHRRQGSLETLHNLGSKLGFSTEVVEPVKYHNTVVSSTAIRHALSIGDISTANAMLTRPFSLAGVVIRGDERGAKLGFPTANLSLNPQQALPADGVYASCAVLNGQSYPAATFIGTRPTFNGVERTVETHLLNYNGSLYNHNLKVNILKWLRGVVKFHDVQALKTQIASDITQIHQLLSAHNS